MWGHLSLGMNLPLSDPTGCRPRWMKSSVLRGTLTTRTWGDCSTCPRCGGGRAASGQMWVRSAQACCLPNPLEQGFSSIPTHENTLGDGRDFPCLDCPRPMTSELLGAGPRQQHCKGFPGNSNMQPRLETSPSVNGAVFALTLSFPPRGPGPAAPSPGRRSTAKDLACAVGVPRMLGALVQR